MATQSEDIIPARNTQDPQGSDSEGEDTIADYPSFPSKTPGIPQLDPFNLPAGPEDVAAYLAGLSPPRTTGSTLPKRGLKDFEPDPTELQASTLEASRKAMNDALLHTRLHAPKTRIVGIFDERSGETKVKRRKGNWLSSVGKDVAGGGVVLRREEALWALERGSLDVRFRKGAYTRTDDRNSTPGNQNKSEKGAIEENELLDHSAEDEDSLPMSLQAAYATLIAPQTDAPGGRLTMEEYVVYAGLKRAGFIVLRARSTDRWKSVAREMSQQDGQWVPKDNILSSSKVRLGLFSWLISLLPLVSDREKLDQSRLHNGPLARPGLYRNYQDVYRLITLNAATSVCPIEADILKPAGNNLSPYTTTFHVYKSHPSRPFKKRDPGSPDFRICVVNANATRLPTLPELESLLNEQPVELPSASSIEQRNKRNMGQTYAALKRGRRNVILAIVDEGLVSYMRVGDAVFAQEGRLFEREGFGGVGGAGGKGKGGGGRGQRRTRGA